MWERKSWSLIAILIVLCLVAGGAIGWFARPTKEFELDYAEDQIYYLETQISNLEDKIAELEWSLPRPDVGYVPFLWNISGLTPYEEKIFPWEYNHHSGMIEYYDNTTFDIIQIYYEPAPERELTSSDVEQDANDIFQRELDYTPDETGIINIAGTTAGYAKGYDHLYDVYQLQVILVLDQIYMHVYALYDAIPIVEDRIMDIIDSISVN